jgi:pimeloyl-ACP methyl ester carboxylesterase
VPERPYETTDTQGDINAEAEQFADFIERVHDAQPGLPIDVIAHSLGGLVARRGLEVLADRHGAQWVLDNINLFATIASPHSGADLATLVHMVNYTPDGDAAFETAELVLGLDADSPAAKQLAETSDLVRHFEETPVLEGLNALAIGVTSDWVVPVPHTRAAGMTGTIVDHNSLNAHDDAPGLSGTTRELGLALDGRPPGCRSFIDAFQDEGTGQLISLAEDHAGIGATYIALRSALRSVPGLS